MRPAGRGHHLDGLPEHVTVTRKRHPFEGRSLAVLGWTHRRGVRHLMLEQPDGSRSLIPVAWTDLAAEDSPTTSDGHPAEQPLASAALLLLMRVVVDALLRRLPSSPPDRPQSEIRNE